MLAVAAEAKAEAVSQKKQFVLYFATDYEDFRPLVTRLLSNITTPLFGLQSEEVGHIVYGRCAPQRAALVTRHLSHRARSPAPRQQRAGRFQLCGVVGTCAGRLAGDALSFFLLHHGS